MKIDKNLPEEISFTNEKGVKLVQKVIYICKQANCGDCGGIGHTMEEYMIMRFNISI